MSNESTLPSTPTYSSTPTTFEDDFSRLSVNSQRTLIDDTPNENGDEELERFRAEWRRELEIQQKPTRQSQSARESGESKQELRGPLAKVQPRGSSPVKHVKSISLSSDYDELESSRIEVARSPEVVQERLVDEGESAVRIYGRAVEAEQNGRLGEALMLYRRAFKLDDDVDTLYARSITRAKATHDRLAAPSPSSTDIVSSSAPSDEPYTFQRHIQLAPDYDHPAPLIQTHTSPLTQLLSTLPIAPSSTQFLPLNEDLPIPLSTLPSELLEPIFTHLDVLSLERFAQTSWRARYLTSHSDLWQKLTNRIYIPPMVSPSFSLSKTLSTYNGEYRSFLINEPRIRMDGVYISLCHYIRPGAGEAWVAITHMITYHRFLRFYPDGGVVSYLTTDMPGEVVPVLKRGLRGKGLHLGRWRLVREGEEKVEKEDVEEKGVKKERGKGKGKARIVITDLLEPGIVPKYEFEMDLALKETGRGRWNKLEISDYRSINLSTEESLSLSLKHQKPFYFSKVRSYHPSF